MFGAVAAVSLGATLFLGEVSGCSREVLDAIKGRAIPDAGDDIPDGRQADAEGGVPTELTVWPNAESFTNSDPWLRQHHDALTLMRPKVLVLNFYNPSTNEQIRTLATQQVALIAESSRYHAYSDPGAPRFLEYQLTQVIDLRDKPGTTSSNLVVPVDSSGAFEAARLFNEEYANRYQIPDPSQPGRNLWLCELFERGLINEVWMAVGDDPPRGPLILERKQKYGASGEPLLGQFSPCAGNEQGVCLPADLPCKVSVRLAHLTPIRGKTCDLEIRGLPFESQGTRDAIPYLAANGASFVNADLQKFGVSFNSWYDVCDQSTSCITYPTPTSATGVYSDTTRWTIPNFIQGCGSARFPPNARSRNDFASPIMVQARCEHFRLRDGPDRSDLFDTYTTARVAAATAAATAQFGSDCGGGWQVYLRQSMPGLGNKAFDINDGPMKNWWPFLFY